MLKTSSIKILALFIVCGCAFVHSAQAEEINLIGAGSKWKQMPVFFPPAVSEASAKAAGKETDLASRTKMLAKRVASGFDTERLPEGWQNPTFDDYDWLNAAASGFTKGGWGQNPGWGPVGPRLSDPYITALGQVGLRGSFEVKDKSKVNKLTLSAAFRGGAIVYLNGKEVARKALPAGDIAYNTPAEDYPAEAFFVTKGDKKEALHWYNHRKTKENDYSKQWALRERRVENIEIDPALLNNGKNVIAVQMHRANYPIECKAKKVGLCFATIGLSEFFLKADTAADNVVTACERPDGFQVWTSNAWEAVHTTDFGSAVNKDQSVKLAGAKNGTFPGQIIIGSTADIESLSVKAGDLKGSNGVIKSKNIRIKYAALNPTHSGGFSWSTGLSAQRFDLLLDSCPTSIPVAKAGQTPGHQKVFRDTLGMPVEPKQAAIQPVWFFIDVPKDAAAGLYTGSLSIAANNQEPVSVPIELHVSDWVLPDVKDYTPPYFMSQSPDSIAELYKVKMWSEEHWKHIEASMKLMGEFGNGGLMLPLMAETCLGNKDGMVTWVKQADGTYTHDFTIFDRYLETAMKYHKLERMKVVGVGVWGYEVRLDKKTGEEKQQGKITVKNSAGETSHLILPKYGTEECIALWKPVLLEVKERLKKYKLEDKLMFGHGGDAFPMPHQVAMFNDILPGTPWYRDSHFNSHGMKYDPNDKNKVVPVGSTSIVWGGAIPDPAQKRLYGWKYNPIHIVFNFNRAGTHCLTLKGFAAPWSFRMWMESTITCGRNGNGRVGADFFKLGVNLRERWGKGARISSEALGGSSGTLFGSYPDSGVAQIGLGNSTTDLLGPSKDGPVTTIRYENARAGNQEAEARIFIEKAIIAKTLPEELAKQCQDHLDTRANALRMWSLSSSKSIGSFAWRQSNQKLFDLAGKVAKISK